MISLKAKEQFMQFSKEPIMSNFGELPFGEIPEPLKYVRPFSKYHSFRQPPGQEMNVLPDDMFNKFIYINNYRLHNTFKWN